MFKNEETEETSSTQIKAEPEPPKPAKKLTSEADILSLRIKQTEKPAPPPVQKKTGPKITPEMIAEASKKPI